VQLVEEQSRPLPVTSSIDRLIASVSAPSTLSYRAKMARAALDTSLDRDVEPLPHRTELIPHGLSHRALLTACRR